MSGYLSNLLTNTTSRYNSLRRTLLSDEADGDTEDDSHISRVLRAYYTEKGQAFPPWLPPDPKRSALPASTPSFASGLLSNNSYAQPTQTAAPRGTLSDLWDSPGKQPAPTQPTSLRRQAQQPAQTRNPEALAPPQARPLPSQRAASFQNQLAQQSRPTSAPSPPPSSAGGGTAQERLKARLRGAARSGSPTSSGPGGRNPYSEGDGGYDSGGGGYRQDRYGGPSGPRGM